MTDSNKENITKTKVENFKEKYQSDKKEEFELFIDLDKFQGFNIDDEVIILKCSDFPEVLNVKNISELRKKIDDTSDNVKRVRELKQKLESAEESYSESLKVMKIKTDLEIDELKKENNTLKRDNKELNLRLKDVTRRINELNSLLNDL